MGAFILASEVILRSLEAVFDLKLKKLIEGSNFWGYVIKEKTFLEPKLGGTDEVRSDLGGLLRPFRGQGQKFKLFLNKAAN